jgi:hypothetical protein
MRNLKNELDSICEELRKDKSEGSYYYSWQSSIAMAFQDAVRRYTNQNGRGNQLDEAFGVGALHEVANEGAKIFLDQLCNR